MAANKRGLFDTIAPYYGLFFNFQVKYYQKILALASEEIDWTKYDSIIDVGCGTGALCSVLSQKGLQVTGIDAEQRMLKIAEKRLRKKKVSLLHANVLERLPFEDKSFDIAISSFVIHGMPTAERIIFYKEMNRITQHMVVFHDYNENRAWLTNLAEWLERGDYFNFIKRARAEMAGSFRELRVIQVDKRAAWYICTPFDE